MGGRVGRWPWPPWVRDPETGVYARDYRPPWLRETFRLHLKQTARSEWHWSTVAVVRDRRGIGSGFTRTLDGAVAFAMKAAEDAPAKPRNLGPAPAKSAARGRADRGWRADGTDGWWADINDCVALVGRASKRGSRYAWQVTRWGVCLGHGKAGSKLLAMGEAAACARTAPPEHRMENADDPAKGKAKAPDT